MNKKPHAFIRRSSAVCAAAALALSGAFIAVPANASPDKETTATTAPATEAPATQAPATEGAVIDDPALVEAIKRDLGMTVKEFVAAGELGKKAANSVKELSAIDGYEGIALVDSKKVVVSGTGDALKTAVEKLGFEFKDTAPKLEAKPADKAEPKEALKAQPTNDPNVILSKFVALYGAENLTSVGYSTDGLVVRAKAGLQPKNSQAPAEVQQAVTGAVVNPTPEEFADALGVKITFVDNGPAAPVYDLTNGHGYYAEGAGLCSVGFTGWDKSGGPALISAGHCTDDGAATSMSLTDPEGDYTSYADAGYPESAATPLPAGDVIVPNMATGTFDQFGGPGNSSAGNLESPDPATWTNIGTDVSTWDVTDSSVKLLSETTKWSDPADLSADTVTLTDVRSAVVGDKVCKSGRTTSWTCGSVTEVGPFLVGGFNGVDDSRGVKGFRADFASTRDGYPGIWGGDSGGSMISGSSAVGITSARDTSNRTTGFGADLSAALAVTAGYTIKLFVNAPTLDNPANNGTVLQGDPISGSANVPNGSAVSIKGTIDGTSFSKSVTVTDGKWSFAAPNASGTFKFTAQAINGFNKSAEAPFTLEVKAAPMEEPAITAPANGESFSRVQSYNGTGTPGATVELQGDGVPAGTTVTVGEDGKWRFVLPEELAYSNNAYKFEARQAEQGDRAASQWVSSSFFVRLGALTITNPGGGAQFDQGVATVKVEGTAPADGPLTVRFDGTDNSVSVEAKDGKWTAEVPAGNLAAGNYDIVANQTVDGFNVPEARVSISIVAPQPTEEPTVPPTEQPKPTTTPTPQPTCETEVVVEIGPDGKPTAKAIPVDPNCDNNGDGLPDTGANGMTMPLVFAGSALLLAGAGAVAYTAIRRRKAQH